MLSDETVKVAYEYLVRSDEVLAPIVLKFGLCDVRPMRGKYFDTLASSIIGQQLSAKAAGTIKLRVARLAGRSRPFRPQDILQCSPEALRGAGLSAAKARYVRNLAQCVVTGELSFRNYQSMGDEDVIGALTQLPGIGRWTAEMFLIFALGRPDVFSEADAGLRRATTLLYGTRKKLSDSSFRRIAMKWSPYRSVASWYLWRSLD